MIEESINIATGVTFMLAGFLGALSPSGPNLLTGTLFGVGLFFLTGNAIMIGVGIFMHLAFLLTTPVKT